MMSAICDIGKMGFFDSEGFIILAKMSIGMIIAEGVAI